MRLLATHFDHRKPDKSRLASVAVVNELLANEPTTPTVLAGDLNAVRDSQPLEKLAAMWQQPKQQYPTVPVGKPARQIDYVLTSREAGLKIVETSVLSEAVASDHRPLLSVVEVRTEKTADSKPIPGGAEE